MFTAHICKRLGNTVYKISTVPCKTNDRFALSLLYFSTSLVKKSQRNDLLLEILLHKYHFSPQAASRVASDLTHLKNTEEADATLSFFKESGFSNTQLEMVMKYRPRFLSASLEETIKPKIKVFKDLGCSSDELAKLISNDPWILCPGLQLIIPSISVLKGFLGSNAEVARLLRVSGWFLTTDLRKCLEPNVEFLKSCGVSLDQLVSIIFHFPRFLLSDPETVRKSAKKADEMGVLRSSKMYVHALRVLCSMSEKTWQMKLQIFRDIGFSERDIFRVFRQAPIVFHVSEKKIKNAAQLVRSTGKYDVSAIINKPTALCRSVEKCYKPRISVLEALEGKSLVEKWPSFSTFCNMRDKEFIEKYVSPYASLVGDIYYQTGKRKRVSSTKMGLKS